MYSQDVGFRRSRERGHHGRCLDGLSAHARDLLQRRPLLRRNGCQRLLRSTVGVHLVHQGDITSEVADHERRGLSSHLGSRLSRQKEGEVERDHHGGHINGLAPATRELEFHDGFVKFRVLRQKVAYRFSCVIIVESRENHGDIDQGRPVVRRRTKLKVHGMAQQCGKLPPQICCRCRFARFDLRDFSRHVLSVSGCSECLLGAPLGNDFINEGCIAPKIPYDDSGSFLSSHLGSRLSRQKEGEVERDHHGGHVNGLPPATRELEFQYG